MGWVDQFHGQVVALDTAPLIYFIERHPIFLPIVRPFFKALDQGSLAVVTSVLTLEEVLVHPIRNANVSLAEKYREVLLNTTGLVMADFTKDIAEEAARLRALHKIRTPDAIQLATAIKSGATCFLTNDYQLASVPDVKVLILEQLQDISPS